MDKTSAARHIKTGQYRSELSDSKIKGFHLQKMKSGGKYRLRFTSPVTEKQRIITLGIYVDGTRDRTDAKHLATIYIADIKQGKDPIVEREKKAVQDREKIQVEKLKNRQLTTVGSYLENHYKQHLSRKKDEGRPTYNRIKNTFNAWLKLPMSSLDEAMLHEWQKTYEVNHTYDTCKHVFALLKTMLRHAVKNEIITKNPLKDCELLEETFIEKNKLQEKKTTSERKMFTKNEMTKIKKAVGIYRQQIIDQRESSRQHGKPDLPSFRELSHPHWFFPFFAIAATTGMRVGDIYNLQWHHINFEEKSLRKVANKTQHHRDPAVLDLHLHPPVLKPLHDWFVQQGCPSDGLVFPSPRTGKQLDRKAHETHWKNILRIAGIDEHIVFYSLRHHFISRLVNNNTTSLFEIAKLVGHKSIDMIQQNYAKIDKESAKRSLSVVSGDFV